MTVGKKNTMYTSDIICNILQPSLGTAQSRSRMKVYRLRQTANAIVK